MDSSTIKAYLNETGVTKFKVFICTDNKDHHFNFFKVSLQMLWPIWLFILTNIHK